MSSNFFDLEPYPIVRMRIPAFGYSLKEFTVIELPKLGQFVQSGECACVLESDKAVHEVATPCSGTVSELHASLGQILPVGSLLISIAGDERSKKKSSTASAVLEDNADVGRIDLNQAWQITQMKDEDFEEAWNIWIVNQMLASRDWDTQNVPDLRNQFVEMLEGGRRPPFTLHCAFRNGQLDGWAGIFPAKNNPLSRAKIGEVSLYVRNPSAIHTPAVLLMSHLISYATCSGMAFLIGMTNPNNLPVQKLLQATNFVLLGSAGKLQTQIWIYNI